MSCGAGGDAPSNEEILAATRAYRQKMKRQSSRIGEEPHRYLLRCRLSMTYALFVKPRPRNGRSLTRRPGSFPARAARRRASSTSPRSSPGTSCRSCPPCGASLACARRSPALPVEIEFALSLPPERAHRGSARAARGRPLAPRHRHPLSQPSDRKVSRVSGLRSKLPSSRGSAQAVSASSALRRSSPGPIRAS